MKTKLLLWFILILFVIIACDDLVSPDLDSGPNNINIQEIDANTLKISWTYFATEEDSIRYHVSKKSGSNNWDSSYAQTDNQYYYENTPAFDTLVVSYKVSAFSSATSITSPNSEVVAYFAAQTSPYNVEIEQLTENMIKIKWDCVASGIDGFKIDKKIDDGSWDTEYKILSNTQFQFTDESELFHNLTYRVYAYAGISNSDSSEESYVPTMINPSELVTQKLDNSRVKLSWVDNSNSEQGFWIDKKIGQQDWQIDHAQVTSDFTEFIDNIDVQTASIYYRVKAFSDTSNSDYSNISKINILFDQIGQIDTDGNAYDIVVKDWIAYVADHYNGLGIFDCSNPSDIQEITHDLAIPDRTLAIDIENELLYVSSTSENSEQGIINIVDINDLNNPVNFTNFFTMGIPFDLVVNGDHTFVADGDAGLSIYYTNTSTPMFISNIDIGGTANKIKLYDHYVFVSTGTNGLKIIDLQDINNPQLVSNYSSNFLTDMFVDDGYAYLSDADLGLIILDITDPENPIELSSLQTGEFASAISVYGNRAFIADKIFGLRAIDIQDKNQPTIVGSIDYSTQPNSLFQYSSYQFFTDNEGFKTIQIKE